MIKIQKKDFSIEKEIQSIKEKHSDVGAVNTFIGYVKDLNNKIVKFIGDPAKRIKEDNLRILRYFRFVAQYSKSSKDIEKKSLNACINNRLLLRNLSKERLNFEFKKLILSDNAGFSISLLKKYQIIDFILDGLGKLNEKDIKLFKTILLAHKSGSI